MTRLLRLLLLAVVAAADVGPPRRVPRAVLFDFDGSLAQSEEAHRKRFAYACRTEIAPATWYGECVGHSSAWIVEHLTGRAPDDACLERLRARAAAPAFLADVLLRRFLVVTSPARTAPAR